MLYQLSYAPEYAAELPILKYLQQLTVSIDIKPGSDPNRPTMEILALFADQASTRAFFARTLPAQEYLEKMRLTFFDGDKEVGRLPIEVWEDNFVATYKVPGYEMEKGKVCS